MNASLFKIFLIELMERPPSSMMHDKWRYKNAIFDALNFRV